MHLRKTPVHAWGRMLLTKPLFHLSRNPPRYRTKKLIVMRPVAILTNQRFHKARLDDASSLEIRAIRQRLNVRKTALKKQFTLVIGRARPTFFDALDEVCEYCSMAPRQNPWVKKGLESGPSTGITRAPLG